MKELDTNTLKGLPGSHPTGLNIVDTLKLWKKSYRFNTISTKISMTFSHGSTVIWNYHKLIGNYKRLPVTKTM